MIPQTFIFIGRSGCGKGTQVNMVLDYLKKNDPTRTTFQLGTGARFREFIKKSTYTSDISKKIYETGGLQPEFLAVATWANGFVEDLKEDQHIILDGCPRKLHEAQVMDSAMTFYKRGKAHIVFMNVSRDWAMMRLKGRARVDDIDKDIEERFRWYEADVVPMIEFYRKHPNYHFVEINGEQAIEKVHQDIIEKCYGTH